MVCPPPRRCCILRRRINRNKRGGAVPLSTYENIIPQCGKFVKRLEAVFKKYFGEFFCLGGGHFFALNFVLVISVKGKLKWKERREKKKKEEKKEIKKRKGLSKEKKIYSYIYKYIYSYIKEKREGS